MMEVYVKEEHEYDDQGAGETEEGRICEKQVKEEIVVEPELSGMFAAAEETDEEALEYKTISHPNQRMEKDLRSVNQRAPVANASVAEEIEKEASEDKTIARPDQGMKSTLRSVNQCAPVANASAPIEQTKQERDAQPQKRQRRQPTKTHVCETCNKVFNRINNLKNHQQIHKQVTYCKVCKKDLLTRRKLRNHTRRFHSEQPYACGECNKEFKEAYELKRHTRIHTGEKPYLCEMCEKAFSNAGALKDHRESHNDIKRFSCDACPKQFKHKYSLKIHLLSHTGQKPYPCEICSKDFIRPADLKEHMLSHGPLKPYACEKCGTQFSRKDTFYRHAKRKLCMGVSDEKARLVRTSLAFSPETSRIEDCNWTGVQNLCEVEVTTE